MQSGSKWTWGRVRRPVGQVVEAATLALLWLMLSADALAHWLVGYYPSRIHRQRAQSTIEIVIGMAVLAALALAVWKVIGPAVMTKATGVATDLNTSGTGATGAG